MKKKIRRIYFIVFHSHEAKTSLEISHLKCFLPTKSFSLSKRFIKFSEILHEIILKKFQVKFLRGFSGEMFNSVRFTHEIKSSECFFDRFHTDTQKKLINSPQFFSLSHEERKNIYIFVVILNYFPGQKKRFFSLSLTLEKTKFS